MAQALRSLAGVCDVVPVRGPRAGAVADVLFEVPHGATEAADYADLQRLLRSPLPSDLQDFFFVNTAVGAPELALATAERYVAQDPRHSALVVRSRIPRTFVDCNRVIDEGTIAGNAQGM